MPNGREEVWRFTPLAAFARVLSGDVSDAHLDWDAELPAGVTLTELAVGDPLLETLPMPVDRTSALAVANSGGVHAAVDPGQRRARRAGHRAPDRHWWARPRPT